MKKEKKKKDELKSEKKSKRSHNNREVEPVISFDAFFNKMVKNRSDVHPHHKAPMQAFASKRGMLSATEKDYKKLFSSY
ncbi:MAG: hypothetical protein GWN01_15335 [Nitrosopumilaceae archaeon]|nr:hypothetical protein [Nitrosopumilaceae archaeon]NIU87499.1 hypothetical protein [Nitrosopumilaceae archaeon]NIX62816.1 hypothetical protein [Nitrosopumilaceae archaeon]